MSKAEVSVGLYQEITSNVNETLSNLHKNGYDMMVTPVAVLIPHNSNTVDNEMNLKRNEQAVILMQSARHRIITLISGDIDCDSTCDIVRRSSEAKLLQQLSMADHLGTPSMMPLQSKVTHNLARIITNSQIKNYVAMVLPIVLEVQPDREDSWTRWNNFRSTADFNPRIAVVLEMSAMIPSEAEMNRWLGEPVVHIVIPCHLFQGGIHPVLSTAHQAIVMAFARNKVDCLVKSFASDGRLAEFSKYIRQLYSNALADVPIHKYDDFIGIPLQPLHDNLDANTYEIFEKDPVKYSKYQQAMERAFIDMVTDFDILTRTIVVMVVGAGRGPLVRAVLNAAANTLRKIKIYVIEKNPCAIITLNALIENMWPGKDITLFACDMRDFAPPEEVDILVSELLGAFGDNELSPECLDGAQKHLKPSGISIPSRSTSYINPIMSSRLYNQVRYSKRAHHPRKNSQPYQDNMEQMCTAFLNNVFHIDEPQPVFTFNHPNMCHPIDNRRFQTLRFTTSIAAVLHGFAGYFEAVLYEDIKISINPMSLSKGMCSWFPVFFPISEPIQLKAGDMIELKFWRDVSKYSVWYEWCVTAPTITHIHNLGGRRDPIHM